MFKPPKLDELKDKEKKPKRKLTIIKNSKVFLQRESQLQQQLNESRVLINPSPLQKFPSSVSQILQKKKKCAEREKPVPSKQISYELHEIPQSEFER